MDQIPIKYLVTQAQGLQQELGGEDGLKTENYSSKYHFFPTSAAVFFYILDCHYKALSSYSLFKMYQTFHLKTSKRRTE